MFKKKPSIKTLSPLRSSDRRKTADRIISDYGLQSAAQTEANSDEDSKAAHTSLRNSLLPDNALSAKFTTTHGPALTEVTGTVYVGSHGAGEQRVLWVKLEETLYPSVYTLWQNPNIVPLLRTPTLVVDKIKGGADLMTPGLAGPPFPIAAKRGAVVAIASLDSPTVPLVVGTCEIDISSLTETRGVKGKAVEVFHWAGDDLWDWSTSGRAGISPPDELQGWSTSTDEQELVEQTHELQVQDDYEDTAVDGGVSLNATSVQKGELREAIGVEGEDGPEPDMSTQEIDNAFKQAFLYGVHAQIQANQSSPKYGFSFPLSQSTVMSGLVLPYLPAHTDKQAEQLNIKKTSWKNIKKFLKSLHQDRLILTKDVKTEMLVLDIDFDDGQIAQFQPYRLPKRDKGGTANDKKITPPANTSTDDSVGQRLKVAHLFKPQSSLSVVFGKGEGGPKAFYTASDVKNIVTAYVDSENLVSTTNKRMVKLNPVLSNGLLSTSNPKDKDTLQRGEMPRDGLIEKIIASSAQFHVILRNDDTLDTTRTKPRPGPAPRIEIVMETRSGNKTATRVHGFENYYVSAQPFADELRKVCAGSTSVEPYKAGKGMEVMVQGPQRDAVIKSLEKRGVNRTWIDVTDKTKGKKK